MRRVPAWSNVGVRCGGGGGGGGVLSECAGSTLGVLGEYFEIEWRCGEYFGEYFEPTGYLGEYFGEYFENGACQRAWRGVLWGVIF